ncbi:MAG: RtcB family protein [Burkholderiales bacterium]|nr:RtcB family protein [Anaerolineae bacterium]
MRGDQRKKAWDIFKKDGLEAANAYADKFAPKPVIERLELLNKPVPYRIWGADNIEQGALDQMNNSARLPISVAGALMPDAHQGYGLPIGGVLATEGAVIPYAVGVDIACRMMLTVYPVSGDTLNDAREFEHLREIVMANTTFGAGEIGLNAGNLEHPVLDESKWQATDLLRGLRNTAIWQVGTSGTGNHFCDVGTLTVQPDNPFVLKPGAYLAVLTHSGSRGVGYKIADYYSKLAMSRMPGLPESVKHLAWLSLDSEAGQEYWHAMELAGEFASANHHTIHRRITSAMGVQPVVTIENHHNFAWRETVNVGGVEKDVIVHRKGATPAGKGVFGIIPGTMADPGFVVMGKGNAESINSASHGGGRMMSRTKAKKNITPKEHKDYLKKRGVTLIGGGLDEAPQAYKRIEEVMGAQADLVDVVGVFKPSLVRMAADDGGAPWKKKKLARTDIVDAEGD